MPKWTVDGMIALGVSVVVEADSQEEALEKAEALAPTVYAGDSSGQHLGFVADGKTSWWATDCWIEVDEVRPEE